jgi:hypothetical protein
VQAYSHTPLIRCSGNPLNDISSNLFKVSQKRLSRSKERNEWSEDRNLQTFITFVQNKDGRVSALIKGLDVALPLYKNHRTSNLDSLTPYGASLTSDQKVTAQFMNRLLSEYPDAFRRGLGYRLQNKTMSLDNLWNFITGRNMVMVYPKGDVNVLIMDIILPYYQNFWPGVQEMRYIDDLSQWGDRGSYYGRPKNHYFEDLTEGTAFMVNTVILPYYKKYWPNVQEMRYVSDQSDWGDKGTYYGRPDDGYYFRKDIAEADPIGAMYSYAQVAYNGVNSRGFSKTKFRGYAGLTLESLETFLQGQAKYYRETYNRTFDTRVPDHIRSVLPKK